jgi:hypothetical protein
MATPLLIASLKNSTALLLGVLPVNIVINHFQDVATGAKFNTSGLPVTSSPRRRLQAPAGAACPASSVAGACGVSISVTANLGYDLKANTLTVAKGLVSNPTYATSVLNTVASSLSLSPQFLSVSVPQASLVDNTVAPPAPTPPDNSGGIAGGIIGALVVIGCAGFFYWRREQSILAEKRAMLAHYKEETDKLSIRNPMQTPAQLAAERDARIEAARGEDGELDYDELEADDLRALCEQKGISTEGKIKVLRKRLFAYDDENPATPQLAAKKAAA